MKAAAIAVNPLEHLWGICYAKSGSLAGDHQQDHFMGGLF